MGFWMVHSPEPPPQPRKPGSEDIRLQMRGLEHEINRLKLLNQALWELLRERAKLTDADLEAKAREVDMRDGVEDGELGYRALRCPSCNRVSSGKHWRCLYCGQEFEKPAMG